MDELVVVLGALVILVLSIAGLNIYRLRTDVLTGPYISNRDDERSIPDARADRLNGAVDPNRLCSRLQSTLLSVKGLYSKNVAGRLTARTRIDPE